MARVAAEAGDEELASIRARKLAELRRLAARPAAADPEPVVLTDATLPEFLAGHRLAVVDCWAPWCGPCRLVEPVVAGLARELAGRVAFGKLNVDENPRAAQGFGVQAIPTLLVFRDGRLADRIVGAVPRGAILAKLRP